MGRLCSAGLLTVAQSSRSAPTAAVLQTYIDLPAAATEVIRLPSWFYRTTPYMERLVMAAVGSMERYSPSTPMAQALRPCIISRQVQVLLTPIATAAIRLQV